MCWALILTDAFVYNFSSSSLKPYEEEAGFVPTLQESFEKEACHNCTVDTWRRYKQTPNCPHPNDLGFTVWALSAMIPCVNFYCGFQQSLTDEVMMQRLRQYLTTHLSLYYFTSVVGTGAGSIYFMSSLPPKPQAVNTASYTCLCQLNVYQMKQRVSCSKAALGSQSFLHNQWFLRRFFWCSSWIQAQLLPLLTLCFFSMM